MSGYQNAYEATFSSNANYICHSNEDFENPNLNRFEYWNLKSNLSMEITNYFPLIYRKLFRLVDRSKRDQRYFMTTIDRLICDMRYCLLLLCVECFILVNSLFHVLAWQSDVSNVNNELNIVINRNLINCQCLVIVVVQPLLQPLSLMMLLMLWDICTLSIYTIHFVYEKDIHCLLPHFSSLASWQRLGWDVHGASESYTKDAMTSRAKMYFYFGIICRLVPSRFVRCMCIISICHDEQILTLNMHYKQQTAIETNADSLHENGSERAWFARTHTHTQTYTCIRESVQSFHCLHCI